MEEGLKMKTSSDRGGAKQGEEYSGELILQSPLKHTKNPKMGSFDLVRTWKNNYQGEMQELEPDVG